jgi:hypothetical protein
VALYIDPNAVVYWVAVLLPNGRAITAAADNQFPGGQIFASQEPCERELAANDQANSAGFKIITLKDHREYRVVARCCAKRRPSADLVRVAANEREMRAGVLLYLAVLREGYSVGVRHHAVTARSARCDARGGTSRHG